MIAKLPSVSLWCRLPQECKTLIYEFDSTYTQWHQNQVLLLERGNPWSELCFYQQMTKVQYKTSLYAILMESFASFHGEMPFAHELDFFELLSIPKYRHGKEKPSKSSKEFQYCHIQYERKHYRFLVWYDCPFSLETFVMKYAELVDPSILSQMCVLFYQNNLDDPTQYDSMLVYQKNLDGPIEADNLTWRYNSTTIMKLALSQDYPKAFLECNPNYFLRLARIQDKLVIEVDFIEEYTLPESQWLNMHVDDYYYGLLDDLMNLLRQMNP